MPPAIRLNTQYFPIILLLLLSFNQPSFSLFLSIHPKNTIEEEEDGRDGGGRLLHAVWGTYLPPQPFISKDDLKKSFWKNIHFEGVVSSLNRMIINFYEASILPSVCSSIHPFLQIILMPNLQCGMEFNVFRPPNSSNDICLLFCIYPSSITPTHKERELFLDESL